MPLLDSTLAQVLFAFAMIGAFALILRWTFSRDVRTMPDASADSPGGDAIGVTDASLTVTGGSDEPSPAEPRADTPRESTEGRPPTEGRASSKGSASPKGSASSAGSASPKGSGRSAKFVRRGSDRDSNVERNSSREPGATGPAPTDPAFAVFAELPSSALPPDPEDYGLLRPATIVDTADEANQIKALLAKSGIRATTALGTDQYVRVLVFRPELDRARRLILRRPAE